uniref:EF-hand domain-containing protein n=1 Tax=Arion vulgaris TaxID=1028688 RepID=A0A0B7A4W4_9EUPU
MKGVVDYKHPKKMKKRRQLDALVDTIKLPRSRKNSASAQELLDCHSDSSEVDELTLSQSSSKKKRCCICQSIVARIGLFMVTMACLTTCIGIIWVQWHLRHELDSLRKQVTSAQNSESVSPDVLKIQSQLAEVNKSVTNMKTGPYGLQETTNTITSIKNKLKELTEANTRLQSSVAASKEVLELPSKMNALSTMLATLGSDFKDFMNMQTSKYIELEKRVTAVEIEAKEVSKDKTSLLDNKASQKLSQELINYNISLHTGLQSVNQELERQSVRMSTLEEFTKPQPLSSSFSLNNTEVNDMIAKLIQEKVANNPDAMNVSENDLTQKLFSKEVASLLKKHEQLNDTVLVLRKELDTLVGRLENHDRTLTDLTTAVDRIKNNDIFQHSTHFSNAATTPDGRAISKTHSDNILTGGDNTAEVFHIDGINTFEDLVKAFNESKRANSELDIDSLNDIMNTTVQADDLKQFDLDKNGLYSEDELAKALGFYQNPR